MEVQINYHSSSPKATAKFAVLLLSLETKPMSKHHANYRKQHQIAVKDITSEFIRELAKRLELGDNDPTACLEDGTLVYFDLNDQPYYTAHGQAYELDQDEVILFPIEQ